MNVKHTSITCPHCGHPMHVELDFSAGDQDYYEECANCCEAIHLNMHINDLRRKIELAVSADDEQLY
jgi:transcription elongation factor Elf1